MLVLCYGIPKSGSTLCFELVKGVLQGAGVPQERLPAVGTRQARRPGRKPPEKLNKKNFIERPRGQSPAEFQQIILRLIEAVGPDRTIAVKTHMSAPPVCFAWLEGLQAERKLQVIASYRDPRDICLSLKDAPLFGRVTNLEIAAQHVESRIRQFRYWASLRGALRLCYETFAFAPDNAIDLIEEALGVRCNREEAKKYAFSAKTPRNKAVPHRYMTDMSADEKRAYTERFRTFIQKVCIENDQEWFDEHRRKLLTMRSDTDPAFDAERRVDELDLLD